MAFPGKREGLAQKVDTAAKEAERLGLTTATLYFEWHAWRLTGPNPTRLKVCQGTTGAASQTDSPKKHDLCSESDFSRFCAQFSGVGP